MHDGKSCDGGQIYIYSPQIKGTYVAISVTEDVTEDTGLNSQLYNSAMSPRCNNHFCHQKKRGKNHLHKTF